MNKFYNKNLENNDDMNNQKEYSTEDVYEEDEELQLRVEKQLEKELKEELDENIFENDVELEELEEVKDVEVKVKKEKKITPIENLLTEREREDYANENQALIKSVTKKYYETFGKRYSFTYEDVFGIATFGFTKALLNYDKTNVAKFSTYAVACMKNEIFLSVRKEKKRVNDISIETVLCDDKNGNSLTLEDILESGLKNVEETILSQEQNFILGKAIKCLSKKEQIIAILRYGIGVEEHTQKEVADIVNMSQANISKIEKTIKKKIKKYLKDNYSY